MRSRIEDSRFTKGQRIDFSDRFFPCVSRSRVGADAAEQLGDRLGISQRAKKCLNSGSPEGRKEILQIHSQNNALAKMGSHERFNGSAFDKTVRRRVRRNFFQNLSQNLPLQFFQTRLRRFDQSNAAVGLRQDSVMVVPKFSSGFLATKPL